VFEVEILHLSVSEVPFVRYFVTIVDHGALWGEWWALPRLAQGVGRPEYKELRGTVSVSKPTPCSGYSHTEHRNSMHPTS